MEPLVRNVFRKLTDLRLMTAAEVVDGSSIVIFGRQRNRFVYVKRASGRSFFIKSAHETEIGTEGAIAREAALYRYFATSEINAKLRSHLIEMYHHDTEAGSLILSYLDTAENLQTRLSRQNGDHAALLSQLGRILALCHRNSPQDLAGQSIDFERKPHWIFRLQDAPGTLASLRGRSPASEQWVSHVLARPKWLAALRRARHAWQHSCLIHGDFKFENVLVLPSDSIAPLKLIDWERADIGDPTWDVAYGVAAAMILSLGTQPSLPVRPEVVFSPAVLENCAEFLGGYRQAGGQIPDPGHLIDMICARLLVASYESCNGAATLPDQCIGLMSLVDFIVDQTPVRLTEVISGHHDKEAA